MSWPVTGERANRRKMPLVNIICSPGPQVSFPFLARCSLLTVCLGMFAATYLPVMAFAEDDRMSGRPISVFDIPAQPLASALDAFSTVTGREVFYDGSAERGRWSTAVKGSFKPDDALSLLLSGTNLLAQPSGSSGYTLVSIPKDTSGTAMAARIAADRPYARYFAVIQGGIRDALCRNADTRPGTYKILLKFWIGPSGILERLILRGTTGDSDHDVHLVGALQAVTLAESPPADMPQPITMAIFPGKQASLVGCRDAGNELH